MPRVGNRGGHRHLGGKMVDDISILRRLCNRSGIADVSLDQFKPPSIFFAQPFGILDGTAPREIIESNGVFAALKHSVHHIAANESTTTRDENLAHFTT